MAYIGSAAMPTTMASPTASAMDSSVSDRVTQLTQQDSPLNRAATGIGMRVANRRGLVNSSIASGAATGAVLDRVVPIASQEAAQESTQRISASQLAAAERERLASAVTTAAGNYSSAQSSTLQNENIPGEARAAIQQSNTDILSAQLAAIQRLYGTDLQWGSTGAGASAPTGTVTTGGFTTAPASGSGGGGISGGQIAQTLLSPVSTKLGRKVIGKALTPGGLVGALFG